MAADSIIQGITDYFMACPLLEDGVFRVDALSGNEIEYAIETGVFNPVIQRYVDGSSMRQYQFNFVSRNYYSMDRVQNIKNSGFYEELAAWVEARDMAGEYPSLPDGCEAESIEVMSSGYIMDASMRNAKYQIQLRITYVQEV